MLPRWLIYFRAFALACAFAAAFVPIATYITDDKRDWLWIHIGINIAAYIAVALTTIYTTVNLTQQDHNKFSVPVYWANNVVMRTWYLGVSKTWRWHVAAAVGRLGLALALAQHVNIVALFGSEAYRASQFQGVLRPFSYINYNTLLGNEHLGMMIHTEWGNAIVGFLILGGFALLETSLLSAFTVAITRLTQKTTLAVLIVLRAALICSIVLLMTQTHSLISRDGVSYRNDLYAYYATHRLVYYQWHQLAFSWLDNGTMLATWIMRPTLDLYEAQTEILNTLLAYATYILAIIASLQLAHYLHWRREQRESPTPAPTTP